MNEQMRVSSLARTDDGSAVLRGTSMPALLRFAVGVCLLLSASSLLLLVLPFPSHTRFWSSLQNAGHSLLFATVTLAACTLRDWVTYAASARTARHEAWAVRHYLATAVLLVGFGTAIELVQSTIGRDASVGDIVLDTAGIASGMLLHVALATGLQRRYRVLSTVVALGILLICFQSTLRYAIGNLCRPALPVLASFDHCLAIDTVAANADTTIHVIDAADAWPHNPTAVLQIRFGTGLYPGIRLVDVPEDWSAAGELFLQVYNPGSVAIDASLRIHDRQHDRRYDDRFNRVLHLKPGNNAVSIPMAAITAMSDAADRRMDISNIAGLSLFVYQNAAPVTLYLDDIRLR